MQIIRYFKSPLLFYGLATLISWVMWLIAAYMSHQPANTFDVRVIGTFGLLGLIAPAAIALIFIFSNDVLRGDFFNRLTSSLQISRYFWLLTLLIMPISIVLAQSISVLFGYSWSQFLLAEHFSFSSDIFPVWAILLVAPITEELAWHTYGTDALRNRFNIFTTSITFALFWGLWHLPLGMIRGYYQSNLIEVGWMHTLNSVVSIIPFVIIMNWLYYKTHRNLLVAIAFHLSAVYSNELFATHPVSKLIQTGLLCIFSIYVIRRNSDFFFSKDV